MHLAFQGKGREVQEENGRMGFAACGMWAVRFIEEENRAISPGDNFAGHKIDQEIDNDKNERKKTL